MTQDRIHPNVLLLRSLYEDLTTIAEYATDDMVLHPAIQRACPGTPDIVGRQAALQWERNLIQNSAGTLVMDVEHITANDHFGTVLGTLVARFGGQDFADSFCGLWRFEGGRITEHWENNHDPARLAALVAPESSRL
ncbi:nuclear transport factor 2 family protein [Streptomyces sp. NPDC050738]|uniref:nuclear transport factor 2 family protein n=1 Tax=Streptomyces sp. NPDC050738 TaxID=3154744 RepID=UPI00343CE660